MVKEENAILPAQELRSLPPGQTLSAKLLAARNDRKRGVQYLTVEQVLLGQSHYVNDGHKNGMNTRFLWILLHIILHISTFNHSS